MTPASAPADTLAQPPTDTVAQTATDSLADASAEVLADALSTPHPPVAAGHVVRLQSPLGRIEVTSDGTAITSLTIERDGILPHDDQDEVGDPVLDAAVTQLGEYFAGTRRVFDLPVSLVGTEFQKSVWEQLDGIEWGDSRSYGDIGAATGRESAGRAVGGAIGANPIPIIVPCHRVLASNRRITGYSAGDGIPTKIWLLDHEGIEHR